MGCTISNPGSDHKLSGIGNSPDRETRIPVEQIDSESTDSQKLSPLPISKQRMDVAHQNTVQTKVDDGVDETSHVTYEAREKETRDDANSEKEVGRSVRLMFISKCS